MEGWYENHQDFIKSNGRKQVNGVHHVLHHIIGSKVCIINYNIYYDQYLV